VLKALSSLDHKQALREAVIAAPNGINAVDFKSGRNLDDATYRQLSEIDNIIEYTRPTKQVVFLDSESLEKIRSSMTVAVAQYHKDQPHSAGISQRMLTKLAIDIYTKDGSFERAAEKGLRITGFKPVLDNERQKLLASLYTSLTASTVKPPAASTLAELLDIPREELITQVTPLVEHGSVIQVAENRFFHPEALQLLVQMADELSGENSIDGFNAKQFAAQSGIGRNLTIDVLEYFDREGITKQCNTELKTRVTDHQSLTKNPISPINDDDAK